MAAPNPNAKIYDTVLDRPGDRVSARKDHKAGHTEVEYSSGHTLHWDKTEVGDGKKLKEVRTLTRIQNPHALWTRTQYRDDQYDRIFRKGIYADAKKEEDTNG